MSKKLANFLQKSSKIHNLKYDYSLVKYLNLRTRIDIKCKIHNFIFQQTPEKHLIGRGCPKCGGTTKLTTDEFIEKSIKIHGDEYDYSLVSYKSSNKNIILICKKCLIQFNQLPLNHLRKIGCPKCGGTTKLTTGEFIEKSIKIHGDEYDYSLVKYKLSHSKIKIRHRLCNKIFEQKPNNHLNGQRCPNCFLPPKIDTEIFISNAEKVHGDTYDYKNVNYIKNNKKIFIECCLHGQFEQTPSNHLSGYGCIKCKSSKNELQIDNILRRYNLNYKFQYCFTDLVYRKKLFFDFAIFDNKNNLKVLIEYNGKQHYEFIKFLHRDMETFRVSKYKDDLKMNYCNKNLIPFHIIKYDENIDNSLNLILNGFNLI